MRLKQAAHGSLHPAYKCSFCSDDLLAILGELVGWMMHYLLCSSVLGILKIDSCGQYDANLEYFLVHHECIMCCFLRRHCIK